MTSCPRFAVHWVLDGQITDPMHLMRLEDPLAMQKQVQDPKSRDKGKVDGFSRVGRTIF